MVEAFRVRNSCTDREAFLHQINGDRHVAKRIELDGHLGSVEATVADPDFAIQGADGTVYEYRKGYGPGRWINMFLLVIEEDHDDTMHRVLSAYFTRDIQEGTFLCLNRFEIR